MLYVAQRFRLKVATPLCVKSCVDTVRQPMAPHLSAEELDFVQEQGGQGGQGNHQGGQNGQGGQGSQNGQGSDSGRPGLSGRPGRSGRGWGAVGESVRFAVRSLGTV